MKCHCCNKIYLEFKEYYLCNSCNTLHVPRYDTTIYDKQYYEKYLSLFKSDMNNPLQEVRWNNILKYVNHGKLLDIGCGVGALFANKPNKFKVFGQEINPYCIDHCKKNGYNVDFIKTGKFDVITMYDVLEHFPSLDIIEVIKKQMKGILVLSVPNFKKGLDVLAWKHYRPSEHVFGFSHDSIKAICKKFKLNLIECNFDESKLRLPEDNIATYIIKHL